MGHKRRKKKSLIELLRESEGIILSNKLLIAWINKSVEESTVYIAHLPR